MNTYTRLQAGNDYAWAAYQLDPGSHPKGDCLNHKMREYYKSLLCKALSRLFNSEP